MQRHEINIPTLYSHSIFLGANGKQMMPNKSHLDYFWAIVYLYKSKLLSIKQNGLEKHDDDDKKSHHEINPNTVWDDTPIVIEFYEIHMLFSDETNSDYAKLREFIKLFKTLQIKTNIFGKDPIGSKIVKPVKQIDTISNDLELELILTDEFIKPLLITHSFFKKVSLNFLFNLPTNKSKALYLIFKDYDKFHKNFTKKEIESVVGTVFGNKRISKILDYINDATDIFVTAERLPMKKVAYKYTIKHQKRYISDLEEIQAITKKLIRDEAERKTDEAIETGTKMKSKEAYIRKLFGQMINDEDQYNIFETKAIIDIFINDRKEELKSKIDKNKSGYWYVSIEIEIKDDSKICVIDNNYNVREALFPTYFSQSAELTHTKIKSKIGYRIYFSEHEISNCSKSLIKLT